MKTIITALLIISAIPSFGQNHLVGLQGGVNLTNVVFPDFLSDRDNRTGYNLGLTYQYLLNDRFNLGIDLLYYQRGFTLDLVYIDALGNPIGEMVTNKLNYNYVSIPLKGGIKIGDDFSGFANLGIVPSILVHAVTVIPAIDGIQEESIVNVTDVVTKFDLGGLVEIGANYKLNQAFVLSASIGYQHSLTSIANENYFSGSKIRHHGMQICLGIKYALKKNN